MVLRTTRKRYRIRPNRTLHGGNGEEVGRGSQGKVIRYGNDVIKITDKTTALIEQLAAEKLKHIDPEQRYTLYGTRFEEQPDERKWKVSMKYGGISLQSIEDANWFLRYSKDKVIPAKYIAAAKRIYTDADKILNALEVIKGFVSTLWNHGIIHNDIKSDNFVWDGMHLHIIDWGEAKFEGSKDFAKNKNEDTEALEDYLTSFRSEIETIGPIMSVTNSS